MFTWAWNVVSASPPYQRRWSVCLNDTAHDSFKRRSILQLTTFPLSKRRREKQQQLIQLNERLALGIRTQVCLKLIEYCRRWQASGWLVGHADLVETNSWDIHAYDLFDCRVIIIVILIVTSMNRYVLAELEMVAVTYIYIYMYTYIYIYIFWWWETISKG